MSLMKVALITGVAGQDGSYLAELLLDKGYEVHGLLRRSPQESHKVRLEGILSVPERKDNFFLHFGDVTDASSLARLVTKIRPDEVYNLAAQTHVRVSFELPEQTLNVTALGTLRLLEAIRTAGLSCRFYQASSSEIFGTAPSPQNENSPLRPQSPYGCAKAVAHLLTLSYRQAYGIWGASGIMFNHESPRRGETFVTRKITRAVARIAAGEQKHLFLGNLDARRDWGFAGDYVEAMWQILQADEPDDYVVGTGKSHSVREFCEMAFGYAGLNYKKYIKYDSKLERPAEVADLRADTTKAEKGLGWKPKVSFEELVEMMVDADKKALAHPSQMDLDDLIPESPPE